MNFPVTFATPLWFFALLLLPLLAVFYFLAEKRSEKRLAQLIAPKLRPVLLQGISRGKRLARFALTLLSLAALIVALARPQAGFETQEVKRKGRDVVVAIDTSRSMLADDVTPNRLSRAKLAVQDLLRILEGDRVALVAFAGTAFLQAPLTIDYSAVQDSLEEIDTTIIPKGGTNLAAAIQVSLQAFGKAEGANKALVLFTDGEELDADALKAAALAKAAGVRIFTVGVGSSAGTMIPIQENGTSTFVRDDSGQFVKTKLDESRLKEIAAAADGFYVHLENGSNAVQTLLNDGIQKLEQREGSQFSSRRPIERYQWPLGLAIVLFVLAQSLSDRKVSRRAAGVACAWLALLPMERAQAVEFQFFDRDKRAFNEGWEAYKKEKPEDALKSFGKAATSPDRDVRKKAEYNAANSLFLIGKDKLEKNRTEAIADWKEAISHYNEALKIDSKYDDAKTNRDLVDKLLKEDEKKKEEQQKRDEKDKKDQQDQQQDQAKNDQKQDGKDSKDQQKKDADQKQNQGQPKDDKNGKNGQNKPDQVPQSGDPKQQKKDGEKPDKADAMPTPGEKKEGELKANQGDEKKDEPKEGQIGEAEKPEQEQDGKMSQQQARALIEAMQGEEERVNLREQAREAPVAKDW
ncbi:MAG: VWA domain-containing protein [Chthoniobacterales bacterium]